ncbi:phosphatase PAP2 family protein [Streptococcus dentasini]
MRDYAKFYSQLTRHLRQDSRALKLLALLNQSLTRLMYVLYPCLLVYLIWARQFRQALATFLIPAASFIVVSLLRHWLNHPRPYETWTIEPLIHKESKGNSMPSRHVFSASIVSLCVCQLSPYLSGVCLFLAALLAVCRVLGGVHYPKDVLVGYILGLICGSFVLLA